MKRWLINCSTFGLSSNILQLGIYQTSICDFFSKCKETFIWIFNSRQFLGENFSLKLVIKTHLSTLLKELKSKKWKGFVFRVKSCLLLLCHHLLSCTFIRKTLESTHLIVLIIILFTKQYTVRKYTFCIIQENLQYFIPCRKCNSKKTLKCLTHSLHFFQAQKAFKKG
jgi:hypothetical protein